MSNIEDELTRRLGGMEPEPPEVGGWGPAARARSTRTRRTRAVAGGAGACALVAAVLLAPSLLGGTDDDSAPEPAGPPRHTPSQTSSPSSPATEWTSDLPKFPKDGSVDTPDGNMIGVWEDGEILGDVEVYGTVGDLEQVVYAAKRPFQDPGTNEVTEQTYVAVGLREGSRILQTVNALSLDAIDEDGADLYGGEPQTGGTDGTSYTLLGAVPGDAEVSVAGQGQDRRPATLSSTKVLPGHTVFVDVGAWDAGWDTTKLAPLTVHVGDRELSVRKESTTG